MRSALSRRITGGVGLHLRGNRIAKAWQLYVTAKGATRLAQGGESPGGSCSVLNRFPRFSPLGEYAATHAPESRSGSRYSLLPRRRRRLNDHIRSTPALS